MISSDYIALGIDAARDGQPARVFTSDSWQKKAYMRGYDETVGKARTAYEESMVQFTAAMGNDRACAAAVKERRDAISGTTTGRISSKEPATSNRPQTVFAADTRPWPERSAVDDLDYGRLEQRVIAMQPGLTLVTGAMQKANEAIQAFGKTVDLTTIIPPQGLPRWAGPSHQELMDIFSPPPEEPDFLKWTDSTTGLTCMIQRHPEMGHLCGYVRLPRHHAKYPDASEASYRVHGGVSFKGTLRRQTGGTFPGRWVGFDCSHWQDLVPSLQSLPVCSMGGTYRDIAFVKDQCTQLARQVGAQCN